MEPTLVKIGVLQFLKKRSFRQLSSLIFSEIASFLGIFKFLYNKNQKISDDIKEIGLTFENVS